MRVSIKVRICQKFKIRALIWKFQTTLILKLWKQFLKVSTSQRYQSLPARNSTPPVSKISPRGLCFDPSAPLPLLGEAFLWPLFLTLSINFAASMVMLMKWGSLTHARFKIVTLNAQMLTTIRPTTQTQVCTVVMDTTMVDKLRILKLLSTLTTNSSTVGCLTIILWIARLLQPSSIHFTTTTTVNCNSSPTTGASIMRSTLVAMKHQRSHPSPLTRPMTKKTPLKSSLTAKTSSRRKWCRRLFWLKTLKMAVINTTSTTTSINLLKRAATKKIRKMAASSLTSSQLSYLTHCMKRLRLLTWATFTCQPRTSKFLSYQWLTTNLLSVRKRRSLLPLSSAIFPQVHFLSPLLRNLRARRCMLWLDKLQLVNSLTTSTMTK